MTSTRLQRTLRTTLIGLTVNIVFVFVKMLAGFFGHSQALIADGIESLADILSSVVVWRGMVIAAAPADPEHPYGHGKAEPIAAAVVAGMLLVAALAIAVTSVKEILHPHQLPEPYTLGVLFVVVVVKETLFRFVLREGHHADSSALKTDAWHHRSDAITSLAAAIGISIALMGGRGWEAADDYAALVASGIIAWSGWRLLRPAIEELMDAAPAQEFVQDVKKVAEGVDGVCAVEKCLVRKVGHRFFVDLHVEVNPSITVQAGHDIAHDVKAHLRSKYDRIDDVMVHIEPFQESE